MSVLSTNLSERTPQCMEGWAQSSVVQNLCHLSSFTSIPSAKAQATYIVTAYSAGPDIVRTFQAPIYLPIELKCAHIPLVVQPRDF